MVQILRETTQKYVLQNLSSEFGESSSPGHTHITDSRNWRHYIVAVILLSLFTAAVPITSYLDTIEQTTMPTVNQMNAASHQDAELIDAADPPQLPAPRSQNSTATAAIRRLSVAFGGEHDQAVDSRVGQRPGNERRSQRESENQQSTTAAHTSLSVQ